RHIEISNMEIFHWSGVGVQVVDNVEQAERGRLFNTNPGAVMIKDCFFHENRHSDGDGYGVESAGGAYATFEHNVFDENRHAIAGGSRNKDALDYSGYTFRENLVLSGGGLHCREGSTGGAVIGGIAGGLLGGVLGAVAGAIIGGSDDVICWHTHVIDMHGD